MAEGKQTFVNRKCTQIFDNVCSDIRTVSPDHSENIHSIKHKTYSPDPGCDSCCMKHALCGGVVSFSAEGRSLPQFINKNMFKSNIEKLYEDDEH